MNPDTKQQSDHIFHVWMNHRQDERRKAGEEWEHDLYEFKSMLQFLEYGHSSLEKAFTGSLSAIHKQCSLSATEPIKDNRLICAMGQEVTTCPILQSLKATFDAERNRECGVLGKYYAGVPDTEIYKRMAQVCAWHMYTEQVKGEGRFMDTSEGWLTDESDRMFWRHVYSSMTGSDPDEEAE